MKLLPPVFRHINGHIGPQQFRQDSCNTSKSTDLTSCHRFAAFASIILLTTLLLVQVATAEERSLPKPATSANSPALKLTSPDVIFATDQTFVTQPLWKPINVSPKSGSDAAQPVHREASPGSAPAQTAAIQNISYQVTPKPAAPSAPTQTETPAAQQPATAPAAEASPAVPAAQPTQEAQDVEKPATITLEEIQKRLAVAEADAEIPEEVKTQIIQLYKHGIESLQLVAESVRKTSEFKAERDNGPESIKAARLELEQPVSKPDLELPAAASISDLEQARLTDEELANENLKKIQTWEAKAKVRAERKPQMPALIEKTKQQIADTKKALEMPPVEGELPKVTQARRTDQEAFILLLQQQLEQYRIEQSRYEALSELFPLRRDLLMRQKNFFDKRLENWNVAIADARRLESERQAREAKIKLRNTHPALRELAERNAELTVERKTIQDSINQVTEKLKEINQKYEEISKNLSNVKNKETLGALSTGAGMLLRNQRNRLPAPSRYRESRRFAASEIARLQLEMMPLQDERDELGDIETHIDTLLNDMEAPKTLSTEEIRGMSRDLLSDRRKYLDDLLNDYSNAMTNFGELEVSSGRLVDTIVEFQNFIDERVLWIRSASVIDASTIPRSVTGIQHIFSVKNLTYSSNVLKNDLVENKYIYLAALFVAITVLGLSRRIRLLTLTLGSKSRKPLTTNIPSTLLALGLTIVVASVWPVLIWTIGWRFSSVSGNDFTTSFGIALEFTAIAFWTMEVLRQISRKKGISETFLNWNPKSMAAVHSQLLLVMWTCLPLMFLTSIANVYNEGYWADSVGRLAFITFCLVLATTAGRMLRPSGQILGNLLKSNPDGLMHRTRHLWYPLSILAPMALGVMAILGYQYTAEQLLIRLQFTLWLSISIIIAYTVMTQWVLTLRKQIAMHQARARRAAATPASSEGTNTNSPVPPVESQQIDLSVMNRQMVKLMRVAACVVMLSGSWMIWSQVMPALQVFNRVQLWSTTVNVVESVDLGEGEPTIRNVPRQKWITLGDVLFAVALVGVAILASKNLPGLLELSLLQRLPLDHGERNAITTLCRYGCILFGMILGCKAIGIGWSSVQWLVAALTVGLGFGLQEIFANFVSGLIILFERPIRIGDVVTIDNVTGSVSKIQIRATTIIDWDRKEYIVPNKEFVTGRLLNWTLSDKTNRVVINVGVAYGADTDLALEILNRIAKEHPAVLNDPSPIASFEGFGDSTLSFNLRVYLPNLDNRLKVITDLHLTIDREFRKAGIEIAFPQMDLHIRSMPSKEMRLPFVRVDDEQSDESQAA